MDVIPHCGIDALRLGAARETVAEALGPADKTGFDQHEDGERSEIWTYRLLRLELSFDSEHGYRLSHLTSYHPYTIIDGFNPMGLEEKFLLQRFPHLELDVEISSDEKYYTDPALDLTFGIAKGGVVSVTVFPEFGTRGGAVVWP
ncbi:MAG: hypothetical protein ACU85V_12675 [Gammaproteobacteria bacterium]